MATLSVARDVLVRKSATALVAVEELARALTSTHSAQVAREERKATAVSAQQRAVRLLTSRSRAHRRLMAMVGGGTAAITLISTQVLPLLDAAAVPLLSPMLGALAALLGMQYLILDLRVRRLEDDAALLDENLSDKEFLLGVLSSCLERGWQQQGFSRADLTRGLVDDGRGRTMSRTSSFRDGLLSGARHIGLEELAHRIGPDEVARLVIAKGLSIGAIEEANPAGPALDIPVYVRRSSSR